jgi:hypothetical protein
MGINEQWPGLPLKSFCVLNPAFDLLHCVQWIDLERAENLLGSI